jgi:hypothetical protein
MSVQVLAKIQKLKTNMPNLYVVNKKVIIHQVEKDSVMVVKYKIVRVLLYFGLAKLFKLGRMIGVTFANFVLIGQNFLMRLMQGLSVSNSHAIKPNHIGAVVCFKLL